MIVGSRNEFEQQIKQSLIGAVPRLTVARAVRAALYGPVELPVQAVVSVTARCQWDGFGQLRTFVDMNDSIKSMIGSSAKASQESSRVRPRILFVAPLPSASISDV